MWHRGRVIVALMLVAIPLYSCGDKSSPAASTTGVTVEISIFDFEYVMPQQVASGDSIVLINNDAVKHNLMLLDDSFGIDVDAGETVDLPHFDPGTYEFHCHFHLAMTGVLVVT